MLKQTIYMSQPFGYDQAMLNGILSGARRNNRRDQVTGALICRADIYLQLIEGPEAAIDSLYARIQRDDRHVDVVPLWSGNVRERAFAAWDMLDDPACSWLWSADEVADGAVTRASAEALHGVFARVAAGATACDTIRARIA